MRTCGAGGGFYFVKAVNERAAIGLVQALGAFCRLSQAGKNEFEKFILPALENLLAAADEASLDAIGTLAEDLIALESQHHKEQCGHGKHCSCGGEHGRD